MSTNDQPSEKDNKITIGEIHTEGGDFTGQDKVGGDKVGNDKVEGNKVEIGDISGSKGCTTQYTVAMIFTPFFGESPGQAGAVRNNVIESHVKPIFISGG